MANSVDPDETAHYELSHLDLHCLQKYLIQEGLLSVSGERMCTILVNCVED